MRVLALTRAIARAVHRKRAAAVRYRRRAVIGAMADSHTEAEAEAEAATDADADADRNL